MADDEHLEPDPHEQPVLAALGRWFQARWRSVPYHESYTGSGVRRPS
jgi:hypothetical protein